MMRVSLPRIRFEIGSRRLRREAERPHSGRSQGVRGDRRTLVSRVASCRACLPPQVQRETNELPLGLHLLQHTEPELPEAQHPKRHVLAQPACELPRRERAGGVARCRKGGTFTIITEWNTGLSERHPASRTRNAPKSRLSTVLLMSLGLQRCRQQMLLPRLIGYATRKSSFPLAVQQVHRDDSLLQPYTAQTPWPGFSWNPGRAVHSRFAARGHLPKQENSLIPSPAIKGRLGQFRPRAPVGANTGTAYDECRGVGDCIHISPPPLSLTVGLLYTRIRPMKCTDINLITRA